MKRMMTTSHAAEFYKVYRKYPVLFQDHFEEEWLHPDMKELVVASAKKPDEKKNFSDSSLLREEIANEVFSFNCFSTNFIQIFNEEIENIYCISEKYHIPVKRPNSMNNYGVIVNEMGMRPLITSFQQTYLWPLAKRLFPVEASQFDYHHSFIVRYSADMDLGLDMHVDDSDVTFNVCLGHDFTGATLSFCGMFGASDHRQFKHTYNHQVGRAILHLGSRRHGADDIQSGSRSNLIVWNHNYQYRNSIEYKNRRRAIQYEKEEGSPDEVCLSYTHDRDYLAYKKELPPQVQGQHLHPWCPPRGKEYNGFDHTMPSSGGGEA